MAGQVTTDQALQLYFTKKDKAHKMDASLMNAFSNPLQGTTHPGICRLKALARAHVTSIASA